MAGDDTESSGGDVGIPDGPLATFKPELTVDATCGQAAEAVQLRIQNDGTTTLRITRASADSNYQIASELPLSIEPSMLGTLLVTPPPPSADAELGAMSSGTLSFVTNEPGTPTHEVTLHTTLYGAHLEFADADGTKLSAGLPLKYSGAAQCPDTATYRVRNTGNVGFTLLGPTFPAHFGGVTTGANGKIVPPGDYAELKVGPVSQPDGACSASGSLTFTTQGAFCGAVPSLMLTWPASGGTNCSCVAASE